ncbi:MAG: DUF6443 domain-containing protein [Bacteroidaceae bacterium]|nr:DUF6443 domain-containing protein [Bacteroidaceae bacterium]
MQTILPNQSNAQSIDKNYILSEVMLDSLKENSSVKTIQYHDGLGRPTILASGGMNTNNNYIYSAIEYNNLGLESRKYLQSIGKKSPSFEDMNSINKMLDKTYGEGQYAYSDYSYDALGRPVFITTVGEKWHIVGKGKKIEYITNDRGNPVKKYEINSNGTALVSSTPAFYSSCTLAGERAIDEDGHWKESYKDFLGNIVLERCNDGKGDIETYYVYEKGKLRIVIPPLYQSTKDNSLLYKYEYNSYGRCSKKTLPGNVVIEYLYDKYGRVAFMQDGRLKTAGKYRFYLYDGLGRLVVQGLTSNVPSNSEKDYIAKAIFNSGKPGIANTGYVLESGTISSPALEIANYYDGYDCLRSIIFESCAGKFVNNPSDVCTTTLLTSQVVATSDGGTLLRVMHYDSKANLTRTQEYLSDGTYTNTASTYTFTNKVDTTVTTVTKKDKSTIIKTVNIYDKLSDLLSSTKISVDDKTFVTTEMYEYDELGRIANVKLHNGRLNTSYKYDLHGWLINTKSTVSSTGKLLFYEDIYYADTPGGTKCYNGNISEVRWLSGDNPYGNNTYNGYIYSYDKMDRLTSAKFTIGGMGMHDYSASSLGHADVSVTYNANSSIMTLKRMGMLRDQGYGLVDDLTYSYSGNQLMSVSDKAAKTLSENASDFVDNTIDTRGGAPEYAYDACGAMTKDLNKGVTKIEYGLLGNPVRVKFSNDSRTVNNETEYVYTADGVRLKTRHITRVPQSNEILSADSTEYAGGFVYTNGKFSMYNFVSGYLEPLSTGYTYRYYMKDHLGNNRVVTSLSGLIMQTNHYYPYGANLTCSTNQDKQQYKYNGKELDRTHGLNWYDYIARQYDAELGQFISMDDFCEKYYHISPYVYCGGNPISRVDPDGMDIWEMDKKGNIAWKEKSETHQLIALDGTGKRTGNVLFLKDRTILDELTKKSIDNKTNFSISSNFSEAASVFLFAANNSDVEWKFQGFKDDSSNKYVVGTTHEPDGVDSRMGENKGNFQETNMIFDIHSHPSVIDDVQGASGYSKTGLYQYDMSNVTNQYYRLREKMPPHYVYHRNSNTLYYYNPWNPSIKKGIIKNYTNLKFLIK